MGFNLACNLFFISHRSALVYLRCKKSHLGLVFAHCQEPVQYFCFVNILAHTHLFYRFHGDLYFYYLELHIDGHRICWLVYRRSIVMISVTFQPCFLIFCGWITLLFSLSVYVISTSSAEETSKWFFGNALLKSNISYRCTHLFLIFTFRSFEFFSTKQK